MRLLRRFWNWLRNQIVQPDPYPYDPLTGEYVDISQSPIVPATPNSTPAHEWLDFIIPILRDGCPDCGHDQFLQGPEGGACVNVTCAHCHSRFNYCWPLNKAHRIEGFEPPHINPYYRPPVVVEPTQPRILRRDD